MNHEQRKVTFDKKAYQRDYMARQRAKLPTSRPKRMEAALRLLASKYDGKLGAWPDFVRKTVAEAIAEPTPPKRAMKEMGDE